jgi:DNA-binding XRE family transcriptional regulator
MFCLNMNIKRASAVRKQRSVARRPNRFIGAERIWRRKEFHESRRNNFWSIFIPPQLLEKPSQELLRKHGIEFRELRFNIGLQKGQHGEVWNQFVRENPTLARDLERAAGKLKNLRTSRGAAKSDAQKANIDRKGFELIEKTDFNEKLYIAYVKLRRLGATNDELARPGAPR